MKKRDEIEIVEHTQMSQLEIFLVGITSRGPHGHDDLELGLLLEGELHLYIDQDHYLLTAGDIYLINRYQIHSFSDAGSGNRILAFQVRPDFYRNVNRTLSFLRFENTIIHSGRLHRELTHTLLSCAQAYYSETLAGQLDCSSLLLHTLGLLLAHTHYTIASAQESTSAQNHSMRLNRIMDYLEEHYRERITLDEIAASEHITPYHLSHFVKDMLGISFQECLNQVRFSHALYLFGHTGLTILDVCMETGFSSSRYLNQMFQKQFGCTAKEYLRMPDRPRLSDTALPTENRQLRLSFAAGRDYLARIFSKRST